MEVIVSILPWLQIALSTLLVLFILAQQSDAGLGSTFGGGDTENIKHTRRGFEKFAFVASLVIAVLFIAGNVIVLVLR